MQQSFQIEGRPPLVSLRRRGDDDAGNNKRWTKSVGMNITQGMGEEEDTDDDANNNSRTLPGRGERKRGSVGGKGGNVGGASYRLRKVVCYVNNSPAADLVKGEGMGG